MCSVVLLYQVLQEYEEAMSLTNGGTQNPRGGASPAPVPVGHQAKPEGLIPKLDEKEIVMEASTVADESTNNTMLDLELLSETMQDEYQKLEERLAEMEQALLIRENLLRDAVQDGSLEAEEEQGETTLGQQSRAEKAMDGEPAGFFTSRRGMGVISNKNLNGSHLSGSGKMADRDSGYSP